MRADALAPTASQASRFQIWIARFAHPLLLSQAVLLLSLLVFDRPLIRGDAVAYFMWTASIGRDFDMDLSNQAERFGPVNTYMAVYNPATGRYVSVFAWGTGLLLQPAFWIARGLDQLPSFRVNDDWFIALQAYPFAYSLMGMLQVNALTLASAAMVYAIARGQGVSRVAAACGGLAVVWGTPFYYYSTVQPLYAHAPATFVHTLAICLAVWAVKLPEARQRWWHSLLAGLAFGLATLTRWQLALSLVIFAVWFASQRRWQAAGFLIAGWALIAWHVPYTFNWMFGAPFAIPAEAVENGGGFLSWPRYLIPVLFSADRGFLIWSPIAALGALGLFALGRRSPGLALALGAVVAAQVLVNAGVRDWYAGESFGLRRLTEVYPALAVGVAALLSAAEVASRRWWLSITYGAVILTALYGLFMVVASLIFHYFTDPSFGFVTTPPPPTALNVLMFFLSPPRLDLVWPMMEHHFGPWAWTWPGP